MWFVSSVGVVTGAVLFGLGGPPSHACLLKRAHFARPEVGPEREKCENVREPKETGLCVGSPFFV